MKSLQPLRLLKKLYKNPTAVHFSLKQTRSLTKGIELDITGHDTNFKVKGNKLLYNECLLYFMNNTRSISEITSEILSKEPDSISTHLLVIWDMLLDGTEKTSNATLNSTLRMIESILEKGVNTNISLRDSHLLSAAYAWCHGYHLIAARLLETYLQHTQYDVLLLKLTQRAYMKAGYIQRAYKCMTEYPILFNTSAQLTPSVLGMYASGCLETGQYKLAEDYAVKAMNRGEDMTAITTHLNTIYYQCNYTELVEQSELYAEKYKLYHHSKFLYYAGIGHIQFENYDLVLKSVENMLDYYKQNPLEFPIDTYEKITTLLWSASLHCSSSALLYAWKDPILAQLWNEHIVTKQYPTQDNMYEIYKMIGIWHSSQQYEQVDKTMFMRSDEEIALYQKEKATSWTNRFKNLFTSSSSSSSSSCSNTTTAAVTSSVSDQIDDNVTTTAAAAATATTTTSSDTFSSIGKLNTKDIPKVVNVDDYLHLLKSYDPSSVNMTKNTTTTSNTTNTTNDHTSIPYIYNSPSTAVASGVSSSTTIPSYHVVWNQLSYKCPHIHHMYTTLLSKYHLSQEEYLQSHHIQKYSDIYHICSGMTHFLNKEYEESLSSLHHISSLQTFNNQLTDISTPLSSSSSSYSSSSTALLSKSGSGLVYDTPSNNTLSHLGGNSISRDIVMTTLIENYMRVGQYKEAEALLNRRTLEFPQDGQAWKRLVVTNKYLGNYDLSQYMSQMAMKLGMRRNFD